MISQKDKALRALAIVAIVYPALAKARDDIQSALDEAQNEPTRDGTISEDEWMSWHPARKALNELLLSMLFLKNCKLGAEPQWNAGARLLLSIASTTAARWDQHIRYDIGDELAEPLIGALEAMFAPSRMAGKLRASL